ncbi:hypothetical protein V2154_16760 [Ewingella sp. CoE-038-23]|uniref:hypothetical protein n=1 Tax=Ewingella docleensis TaxID=3118588 RepID=UPI003365694C
MSKWIDISDDLPKANEFVFVVRKWRDGSLHTITAKRKSTEELTVHEDAGKNAWWESKDSISSFSDSTVVAWSVIPEQLPPAFNGVILPQQDNSNRYPLPYAHSLSAHRDKRHLSPSTCNY